MIDSHFCSFFDYAVSLQSFTQLYWKRIYYFMAPTCKTVNTCMPNT